MMSAPARIRTTEPSDLGAVVDLLNACDVAELGTPDTTVQDVENDWRADGFDLATDAWVATTSGNRLVGYAYAGDQFRSGQLEADFWVHPEHHDEELAGRLLTLAQRRARQLARQRGYGQAAELTVFALTGSLAKIGLLRSQGFTPARSVYRMAIDLAPDAATTPAPAGITIRPFRAGEDDRALYDATQESFAGELWRDDEPFSAWQTRLEGHADFDPGLWFLAWDGERLVGSLLAYDHGDLGWVKALSVRPGWRRRGIGAVLLACAFAELAHRGQRHVELGVDTEGGAHPLRLYERAGMHVAFAYELYVKPLGAAEVSSP